LVQSPAAADQACTGGAAGQARSSEAGGRFELGIVGDIPYTRAQEASTHA
jgi:hypothetical protein